MAVASAKDDAAAYYAGSTLGARIAWDAQAAKNISDTNSLLNATDGAIEHVKAMLQRIRELAMQAANAPAELDRNLLQAEVDQLTQKSTDWRRLLCTTASVCFTVSRIIDKFQVAVTLGYGFLSLLRISGPMKLVRTLISRGENNLACLAAAMLSVRQAPAKSSW